MPASLVTSRRLILSKLFRLSSFNAARSSA